MKILCLALTVLAYADAIPQPLWTLGLNNLYCHPTPTSFVEASNICKGRNQILVEPKFTQHLEKIVKFCGSFPNRWYHTGARRFGGLPGAPFLYPDGTQVPADLWSPGEPNGSSAEEFTEIRPDYRMNDIYAKPLYPVCMDKF